MNNHKSEYGVIQTIRFMIRQAVKEAPAVLVWLVVDAILALILQLLELYVTPVLLRDIEEQIALKEQCDMLNAKGIKFLLSNSSCEFIEDLYKDYIIDHVDAKRAINVKPEKRGEIQEVLVRNYELD